MRTFYHVWTVHTFCFIASISCALLMAAVSKESGIAVREALIISPAIALIALLSHISIARPSYARRVARRLSIRISSASRIQAPRIDLLDAAQSS